MKKLWAYIAMIFIGIAGGMAIMYKLVAKNISSTVIKGKIKQKKTRGSIQDVTNTIEAPGSREDEREEKKTERKMKRDLKKAQRKAERNLRKANK